MGDVELWDSGVADRVRPGSGKDDKRFIVDDRRCSRSENRLRIRFQIRLSQPRSAPANRPDRFIIAWPCAQERRDVTLVRMWSHEMRVRTHRPSREEGGGTDCAGEGTGSIDALWRQSPFARNGTGQTGGGPARFKVARSDATAPRQPRSPHRRYLTELSQRNPAGLAPPVTQQLPRSRGPPVSASAGPGRGRSGFAVLWPLCGRGCGPCGCVAVVEKQRNRKGVGERRDSAGCSGRCRIWFLR